MDDLTEKAGEALAAMDGLFQVLVAVGENACDASPIYPEHLGRAGLALLEHVRREVLVPLEAVEKQLGSIRYRDDGKIELWRRHEGESHWSPVDLDARLGKLDPRPIDLRDPRA